MRKIISFVLVVVMLTAALAGCGQRDVNKYEIRADTITIADGAFGLCYNLANVTIPDSVISIGSGVFTLCRSLASVSIPGSVTSIGERAFSGCNSLTSISIPDSVTSISCC